MLLLKFIYRNDVFNGILLCDGTRAHANLHRFAHTHTDDEYERNPLWVIQFSLEWFYCQNWIIGTNYEGGDISSEVYCFHTHKCLIENDAIQIKSNNLKRMWEFHWIDIIVLVTVCCRKSQTFQYFIRNHIERSSINLQFTKQIVLNKNQIASLFIVIVRLSGGHLYQMINHVNCRIPSFCFMMCLNGLFFLSYHGTLNCYVLKPARSVFASLKLCFAFYDNRSKNGCLLSKYVDLISLARMCVREREGEEEGLKSFIRHGNFARIN